MQSLMKSLLEKRPSFEELYIFFTQFVAFFEAGIAMPMAIHNIIGQTKNEMLKKVLYTAQKRLMDGEPLAVALRNRVFPEFSLEMIAAGEESGTLEESLMEIARDFEQSADIQRKIQSALLPVKMIVGILTIAIFVAVFLVIPRFQQMFTDLKIELPLLTRLVMGAFSLLFNYWYIWLVLAGGVVYLVRRYKRKYPAKIDALILNIPLYKTIAYYMIQYQISKTMMRLRRAGMTPSESLEITARTINNAVIAKLLRRAALSVSQGLDLSKALEKYNDQHLIDPILLNFIETGETTGTMDTLLGKSADYFQNVLKYRIQQFSEKIGPVFLAPMMLAIILFLGAIYYPIFSITQAIK